MQKDHKFLPLQKDFMISCIFFVFDEMNLKFKARPILAHHATEKD